MIFLKSQHLYNSKLRLSYMRGAIKVFLLFVIFLSLILSLNLSVNAALPCPSESEMQSQADFVSGTVVSVETLGEDGDYAYKSAKIQIEEARPKNPTKEVQNSGVIEINFEVPLVAIDGYDDAIYEEGEDVEVYLQLEEDKQYPHKFFGETYWVTYFGHCGKNRGVVDSSRDTNSMIFGVSMIFLGVLFILGLIVLGVVLILHLSKNVNSSKKMKSSKKTKSSNISFNFKKIGLFILVSFVGLILFVFSLFIVGYTSWITLIFFIAFLICLYSTIKDYSNKKLMIILGILILYLVIMLIPFSECDSWGKWNPTSQECTCIGLKKYSLVEDASWSQCIGYPTNYRTTQYDNEVIEETNIPNENLDTG